MTPPSPTMFEDIIDGYFPLQTSITDMMRRRDCIQAVLVVTHAPIMFIPDLSPQAPVPLTIEAGRAGLINTMVLEVTDQGASLRGFAEWRWLDGTPTEDRFDPMTRLAEPAFLQAFATMEAALRMFSRFPRLRLSHAAHTGIVTLR